MALSTFLPPSASKVAIPLLLVAASAMISNIARPFLGSVEARSGDVRLRWRGPSTAPARVVAVPVDAATILKVGPFPWEPHVVPEALASLHAAGARAVIFDFPIAQKAIDVPAEETAGMSKIEAAEYLLERAQVSHRNTLARLRALAARDVTGDIAADLLSQFIVAPDGVSLSPARVPVALAFSAARPGDETLDAPAPGIREGLFLDRVSLAPDGFAGARLQEVIGIGLPSPDEQADVFGVADHVADRDGAVRRHAPVVRYGERVLPSLPLAAAARALGVDPAAIRVESGSLVLPRPDASPIVLPLDSRGRLLIPYRAGDAVPTIAFGDLRGAVGEGSPLAGALAVIYAAPSRGRVATPAGPMPSGRVHAEIARAIAAGDAVTEVHEAVAAAWLAVLALILYATGALLPPGRVVPAALAVGALHVLGAFAAMRVASTLVPLVAPLLFVGLAGTALAWNGVRVSEAERKRLDRLVAELRNLDSGPGLRARLVELDLDVERNPIRLGPYRLTALIERGGMGAVFRAVDESLRRPVALKIVTDIDSEMRSRFQREAELVARISHPNVVQIYGVGEHAGIPYFAMELIDGESLGRQLVSGGPFEPAAALRFAAQIARGLHAAHENGIVHRDVKPSNVLVLHGVAKLVDFGVAKAGDSGLTGTGAILGTADYMSPEQAQGLPVDRRSDLYSLGVTLFRMLAGTLPFSSESAVGVIYKHVHQVAPDLRDARPDLPPEIAEFLGQLLAKDPAARPASAAAVADRLDALAAEIDERHRQTG